MRKIILFIAIAIFISGCFYSRKLPSIPDKIIQYDDYNISSPVGDILTYIDPYKIIDNIKYYMVTTLDNTPKDEIVTDQYINQKIKNLKSAEKKEKLTSMGMKCGSEICKFIGGKRERFLTKECKNSRFFCKYVIVESPAIYIEINIDYKNELSKNTKIIYRNDIKLNNDIKKIPKKEYVWE